MQEEREAVTGSRKPQERANVGGEIKTEDAPGGENESMVSPKRLLGQKQVMDDMK